MKIIIVLFILLQGCTVKEKPDYLYVSRAKYDSLRWAHLAELKAKQKELENCHAGTLKAMKDHYNDLLKYSR